MKKFIKSLLLFLPIVALSYIFLVIMWGEFAPRVLEKNINYRIGSNGHMYSRAKELKDTKDVDVLILGSSHAYRGFDTRLFKDAGIKVFNLGSSAQTPVQTQVLLKRHLDDLNPKLVIYEVYPGTFVSDGIESSLDLIANTKNDKYAFEMAKKLKSIKTFNTLIYGYYCDVFGRNDSFKETRKKGVDLYVPGGYVERDMAYFKTNKYGERKWNVNDMQLNTFAENIKMLKEKNIRVVLVNAPVTSAYYKSYSNNREIDSIMKSRGEYYDFNKMVTLNDSLHFYDSNHLNKDGVKIFNEKLLAEKSIFTAVRQ